MVRKNTIKIRPEITVFVPAYNEEKHLPACLKRLKEQNFSENKYEIVVIDNASTDKTAQVAKQMGARVVREDKKGYVNALRRGFKEAYGKYVAVTDADTIVPRDWVENIYKTFTDRKNVCLVGGGVIFSPKTPLCSFIEPLYNIGLGIFKTASGQNLAIRKDVYEKIGGLDPRINYSVDAWLSFMAHKYGKAVYLPENKVITASRHYKGFTGVIYSLKGSINYLSLLLSKRTVFFEFGDVR